MLQEGHEKNSTGDLNHNNKSSIPHNEQANSDSSSEAPLSSEQSALINKIDVLVKNQPDFDLLEFVIQNQAHIPLKLLFSSKLLQLTKEQERFLSHEDNLQKTLAGDKTIEPPEITNEQGESMVDILGHLLADDTGDAV